MSAVNLGFRGGDRLKLFLEARARDLAQARAVRVGFLEGATYPATARRPGLHMAQVAFWNEFGTSRAPARPFFRGTISRESPTWGGKLAAGLRASDFDSRRALALLGLDVKDAIVATIVGWPADNAPSTVARKGFNHGLIHSGVMQRSVDYQVLR